MGRPPKYNYTSVEEIRQAAAERARQYYYKNKDEINARRREQYRQTKGQVKVKRVIRTPTLILEVIN